MMKNLTLLIFLTLLSAACSKPTNQLNHQFTAPVKAVTNFIVTDATVNYNQDLTSLDFLHNGEYVIVDLGLTGCELGVFLKEYTDRAPVRLVTPEEYYNLTGVGLTPNGFTIDYTPWSEMPNPEILYIQISGNNCNVKADIELVKINLF